MSYSVEWDLDLVHFGVLCKQIRQSRGLSQVDIAELSYVDKATIGRLENKGKTSKTTLQGYIKALQSNKVPHALRITSGQRTMLLDLYDYSLNRIEQELQISTVQFDTIASPTAPPSLRALVDELHHEDNPAFIMDPLGHIHALNGAIWRLFGLDPEHQYLSRWQAWHILGTKFSVDSPVRAAHYDSDEYFPPTVFMFYSDRNTYSYLFTPQMRLLIKRLCELSDANHYKFTQWWIQSLRFNLPFDLKALKRTIRFAPLSGGEAYYIQTRAVILNEVEVELAAGKSVKFRLGSWLPFESDARKAFDEIRKGSWSNDIFFASNYDRERSFHVNDWLRA